MALSSPAKGVTRFGVFELNARSGELRRSGVRVKLQQQPLQLLAVLLERPGEVVTREELREQLWPGDVYVDFDRGLNKAMGRLRETLGESADSPQFIETLPKIGYRFIASATPAPARDASRFESRLKWLVGIGLLGLLGIVVLIAAYPGFSVSRARNWLRRSSMGPVRAIAVLPLSNLSGDPAQEYFADGMTDELITSLAQLGDVQVISRTSVMQYKNTKKTLPQIGRDLNVDAIVEGSVARSGQQVRITAQLVNAATDQHIWAQTYERELGDVLKLQDEAARDIAQEVHIQLRNNPGEHSSRVRPVNPEAYEAYLNGRYFWGKHTGEGFDRAIGYFEQAIKADPNYAVAYAGLADVYQDQAAFVGVPREVTIPKAKAAVEKALELDNNLSEAHDALAGLLEFQDWNLKAAEREHRRAVELNPSNANAHMFYANYLSDRGRFDQAIEEARLAERLDPLSPFVHSVSGWIFRCARQDDRAIEQYRKALEFDPNFGIAHRGLYEVYAQARKYDEAIKEFDEGAKRGGMNLSTLAALDEAYRTGGMPAFLRARLKLLNQGRSEFQPIETANIHALLGDRNEAIGILQQCLKNHNPWLVEVNVNPDFDNLRSDPRFQDVVRAVGAPE